MPAASFTATFLGHQGWLIAGAGTHLLIDPILGDGFGHGGLVGQPFPPRNVDLARLPAIDAVLLTHEHDDHFDLPSLARLSRTIPIYLPRRASTAAWTILAELGFEVRALEPGLPLRIGGLRIHSLALAPHARGGGDEWEVSPFVIHDEGGHGSFASTVDLPAGDDLIAALAALAGLAAPGLGIWTHANNTTFVGYQNALATRAPLAGDDERLAAMLVARHDRLVARGCRPTITAVCGSGWSFAGARAWMNRNHFPIDPWRLCATIEQRRPGAGFRAPIPGERLVLRDGEIVAIEQAPFVTTAPRERWPERGFVGDVVTMPAYAPACGRTTLDAAELDELVARLDDFAAYLYGGPVFAALCASPSLLDDGREAGFCLALLDARAPRVLGYDPAGCRFVVRACDDPIARFASGIECWGADLLGFVRGELGPTALCWAGRSRYWNAAPERLRVSPSELWRYGHPLRRPREALALYRRLLAARSG